MRHGHPPPPGLPDLRAGHRERRPHCDRAVAGPDSRRPGIQPGVASARGLRRLWKLPSSRGITTGTFALRAVIELTLVGLLGEAIGVHVTLRGLSRYGSRPTGKPERRGPH